MIKTIAADGDHYISWERGSTLTPTGTSNILVQSNIDVATLTFGCADADGNFIAFPSGAIVTGKVINHGRCVMMVRVAGIGANPVKIGVFEL